MIRYLELPGIVRALGLVDTGRGLARAMEDAGDRNLAQRIHSGPFPITTFLDIAIQLATAVARLHEARIIHRDIHPGNVVWNSESEVPTLCDFAIARTLPTLAVGSPNPNQLEGTLPICRPSRPDALLFLHQLPSHPSNLRVTTWRRLQQIGAIPLKQAVYALPDTLDAREDFEWLKTEVKAQTLPKNVEAAADRRRPSAFRSPRAPGTLQRLFDVPAQFLVQVLPGSPELLDQGIVGPCINVVGREHLASPPAAASADDSALRSRLSTDQLGPAVMC